MSVKSSNYKSKLKENFIKLLNNEITGVKVDLTQTTIKHVINMIENNNTGNTKLKLELDKKVHYMLNDKTMSQLKRGLLDTNALEDENVISESGKIWFH